MAVSATNLAVPLCVDLDGTLILSDTLLESTLLLLKRNPLNVFLLALWLLRGRAVLKAEIASRVVLNPAALPYNREFVSWLETERAGGRSLWLCTAANVKLADAVAGHLGLFDGVIASDGRTNLAGDSKAARLVERFGERGFDYCGNERRDLKVWRHANGAIVANGGAALEREAATGAPVLRSFPAHGRILRAAFRAIRPHQWAKNALIFVPLLAAHRTGNAQSLVDVVLATIAFCLCASSVYVLNDLLDLEADRAHPRKSKRPFAAGTLSIGAGLALVPVLLGSSILIAAFLPARFQLVFATYYVVTVAYSFSLKGRVIVDAMALAGLYTLRIIAGAAAATVPLSFWLLLFSVFLFLSLAFVKRFAELDSLRRQQRLRAAGRGYHVEDLPVLQSLGTSAGYLSVLVLALYINSPAIEGLYRQPKLIWLLCVLMLYWISRVWMKAQRGEMHDDPVVFALKDRNSLIVGILAVATVVLAV
ncbi:MAG TPA: UbiA family prenyltransferase [Steroidobacteraceae bacterium]|nr:UbiA family prenyltransferase [Steroidobacteraceae bacterium]